MRSFIVAAAICGLVMTPLACNAQAQARFSFEGVANCEKPSLRDYPIRVSGTARLSTDRNASLDAFSNVEGRSNYNVTLGGKPTDVPNGTASLRVRSRSSLRATREYPNNLLIIDLKLVGNQCLLEIKHQLKPGKRQYTFQTPFGIAYCDRPTTTKTTCTGM